MRAKEPNSRFNETLILERIDRNMRDSYLRNGENWGHVNGRFWRLSRILFYFFTLYAFLLNGAHLLALALALDNNYSKQLSGQTTSIATPEKYAATMGYLKQTLVMMALLTLALIVVTVLVYLRRHRTALILSSVNSILSLAMYSQMMNSTYLYIRNFKGIFTLLYAFTVLLPLLLFLLFLIQWKDDRRLRTEYQRLTTKIYRRYAAGGNIITTSQWEEALAEEAARSDEAPPLPERRHRRHYETDGAPDIVE